jgi:hypothetical protein
LNRRNAKNKSASPADSVAANLANGTDTHSQAAGEQAQIRKELGEFERISIRIQRGMLCITVMVAIITAAYVAVTYQQLQVMRGQLAEMKGGSADTHKLAEAAAMQLERTDRPYITVNMSAAGPVTIPDPQFFRDSGPYTKFTFRVTIANEGRSVASAVQIRYKVICPGFSQPSRDPPWVALGRVVDLACSQSNTSHWLPVPIAGRMIRPSEPFIFTIEDELANDFIRAHTIFGDASKEQGLFAPIIVGCATYTIPYSTLIHHTPFAFDIIRRPKVAIDGMDWLFRLGVTVPREEIVLRQNEGALTQHQPD